MLVRSWPLDLALSTPGRVHPDHDVNNADVAGLRAQPKVDRRGVDLFQRVGFDHRHLVVAAVKPTRNDVRQLVGVLGHRLGVLGRNLVDPLPSEIEVRLVDLVNKKPMYLFFFPSGCIASPSSSMEEMAADVTEQLTPFVAVLQSPDRIAT